MKLLNLRVSNRKTNSLSRSFGVICRIGSTVELATLANRDAERLKFPFLLCLEARGKLDRNAVYDVEKNLWVVLLAFKVFDIKVASFH